MGQRRQIKSLLVALRHDPLGVVHDARLARRALTHSAVQKVTELTPLIALVRPRRVRRVIEIGTERGGTLFVWAQIAAPDALIVSIDWPEVAVQELPPLEALHGFARPGQRIELVRADSHAEETRATVEGLVGGGVDLLYIDGDHTYDGARQDFESYAPLVRDGGLIVFHDILPHRPETGCEVERLWRELKPRYRNWEFADADDDDLGFGPWGGIGVIEVPARTAVVADASAVEQPAGAQRP